MEDAKTYLRFAAIVITGAFIAKVIGSSEPYAAGVGCAVLYLFSKGTP